MEWEYYDCGGQVPTHTEPDPFDDAEGEGFDLLSRWGDREYRPWRNRFVNELIHPA